MKHMLLFMSLAAAIVFSSCKKDKSPNYDGTPNAISGQWRIDASAVDFFNNAILPELSFGTDYKYERKGGTVAEPYNEKGVYTLAPGTGGYTITLKPNGGNSYTMAVTELKTNSAMFQSGSSPAFPYIRK